jgi:hypothetical protein
VPFTKALDVIQQAQSGTGKTATFCAGILNNLDYNLLECQALVLAPTRELAQQIEKVMRALGDYLQVGAVAANGGGAGGGAAGDAGIQPPGLAATAPPSITPCAGCVEAAGW